MTSSGSAPIYRGVTFGQWLKEQRNARGLTREELAARIDCSPETIYKIEAGSRRPSRQIAQITARLFDIPADELEAFILFARGQGGVAPPDSRPGSKEHPWRVAQRRLTNIPAPVTSFVGRERDVEQVRALLLRDTVRLVSLVGPPGIGKTRLALEVATDLLNRFEDGITFVPLAPVTDTDLVIPTVAKTVGVSESASQSMPDALIQHLHDSRQTNPAGARQLRADSRCRPTVGATPGRVPLAEDLGDESRGPPPVWREAVPGAPP
jgi:transcriptional regulator with XRE-family HTH domain